MSLAIGALTKALSRSLKAAGYYDESHPILAQIRKQALDALQQACMGVPSITIGSTGNKLLFDPAAPPLGDPAAVQLAEHLFARSIVSIKFEKSAGPKDLGYLMLSLAETPDKIRAAGGFKELLGRHMVRGIEPVEVDFDALFTGKHVQISDLAGEDKVVERTLKEILQIKEKRARVGDAVGVDIAGLTDPNSLGEFLDELMDKAEPGILEPAAGGKGAPGRPGTGGSGGSGGGSGSGAGGAPGGGKSAGVALGTVKSRIGGGGNVRIDALNPDDLAELAAKAYFGNHEYMIDKGTPQEKLAESAKLLSSVLARLRPDARFVMLRKLATQTRAENAPSTAKIAGGKNLSQAVSDQMVVEAIGAILKDQGGDPDTVEAIAELMQQIRPIESERKRLLAELDVGFKKTGHTIDGVLWQEIQSKALKSNGLGMLELSYRDTMDQLVQAAQARIQQTDAPASVRQALDTLQPKAVLGRFKDLWIGVVGRMEAPPDNLLASGTDLAKVLDTQGAPQAALQIAAFLLKQSERATPSSALHAQLRDYLSGPEGIKRTIQIATAYECRGPVMAEAMLDALESPIDSKIKEILLARFAKLDQAGLNAIAVLAQSAKPIRVFNIVRIGLQLNAKTGTQIVRLGLRNKDILAKEMALKALTDFPSPEALSLLSNLAGMLTDPDTAKHLHLDDKDPATEKKIRQFQTLAIGILGDCHSPAAVQPLWYLLVRDAGFGKAHIDQFRPVIAKALSANSTREAQAALQAGVSSKIKTVREACARYVKGA